MKTVQVARRFALDDWGGTETVILETSKSLLRLGHPTQVLCTLATATRTHDTIEGVQVRREPYFYPYFGLSEASRDRLDKKGGSPFSFSLLRRLSQVPKLDLIHTHVGNRLGGIVRYVAARRQIPYVVSIHGGLFDVPPGEAQSWTAPARGSVEWGKILGLWVGSRRLFQDASAILCVSAREAELTRERYPSTRVEHFPNGVDPARFSAGDRTGFRAKHRIDPDARVLGTIARIDRQKNQLMLVETLAELRAAVPAAHLLLVGNPTDAAYYDKLLESVRAGGLEPHVTIIPGLPGGSQELADAYSAADVFVLPSIHEPFGIVILEAWCAGLPVIASRIGGIPWFVEDGRDALLFDPARPQQWLGTAVSLLSDEQRARALAEAGKKKAAERFSWEQIAKRLVGIYEDARRDCRSARC